MNLNFKYQDPVLRYKDLAVQGIKAEGRHNAGVRQKIGREREGK